jgi:hypothetical protein
MRGNKKCHLNKEEYRCVPTDRVHALQVWSTKFKPQYIRKDELRVREKVHFFSLMLRIRLWASSLLHRCCTAWAILTTRIKFVKKKRMLWAGRLSQEKQCTANLASVRVAFQAVCLAFNQTKTSGFCFVVAVAPPWANMLVCHTCNHRYLGGTDQDDGNLKPSSGK